VQVHPSDEQAALLDPPDLGKTEAWYVVDAAPESVLFAGLKSGVDRPALVQAIERGATDDCLHRVAAKRGDCILIPAGTVHAIGAGMLIAEIQQSSDTTYRLFDWNRVDADGRARPLHVEQALDVIDFDRGPVAPEPPKTTDRGYVERLVECEKFILDRWRIDSQCTIGGDDRFHIISVLSGGVRVEGDPTEVPLRKGQTTLLPGASAAVRLDPESETILLDAYLP
jgi:mannose-6-phosphate isomerase